MPEDAGGVAEVEDAEAPGLHGGGLEHDAGVFLAELDGLDVRPPGVGIGDHEVHHEVFGVAFGIEGLEEKAEGTDFEFGDAFLGPELFEAKVNVELPGDGGVRGGNEGFEVEDGGGFSDIHKMEKRLAMRDGRARSERL